jgi:hypothetical protein
MVQGMIKITCITIIIKKQIGIGITFIGKVKNNVIMNEILAKILSHQLVDLKKKL